MQVRVQNLYLQNKKRQQIQSALVKHRSNRLVQHPNQLVASVRKKTKPLFHCEFCPEKFTTEPTLNFHVFLNHSKKRNAEETEARNSPPQKLLKVLSDLSNSPSYEKTEFGKSPEKQVCDPSNSTTDSSNPNCDPETSVITV